jgi:hypothetical protein
MKGETNTRYRHPLEEVRVEEKTRRRRRKPDKKELIKK